MRTKRKVAVLAVAIVAIAGLAFFAPVIGGKPAFHVCPPHALCPYVDYSGWHSSVTYYYLGYGGWLVTNPWTNGQLVAAPGYHVSW